MKTLAIFGSTGSTGKIFLKKALENNYKVHALMRDPSRSGIHHPNLTVIQGDVLNQEDVEKTLEQCDAVVSLIGHVKGSPENLQTKSIENIINGMELFGIKRLISLTGGGVRDPENDKPPFIDKLIVFIMKNLSGARTALMDGRAHADMIKKSDLEWTIVRGPMLTKDPGKGTFQVGYIGTVKGFKLTREDLSDFIISILKNNSYIKKMPFLAN